MQSETAQSKEYRKQICDLRARRLCDGGGSKVRIRKDSAKQFYICPWHSWIARQTPTLKVEGSNPFGQAKTKGTPTVSPLFCFALWTNLARGAREGSHSPRRAVELARKAQGSKYPFGRYRNKGHQGVPSIKQVLISLRDPNGIAVRPSGFDCVRRVILSEA